MKRFLLLFCTIFLATASAPRVAWAFDEDRECTDADGNCDTECETDGTIDTTGCYKVTTIYASGCGETESCTSCNEGYTEVSFIWGNKTGLMCEKGCDASSCKSDTTWKNGNTGYQYKTNRGCDYNECVETTVYQCAAGYYGSSANGTSGCTKCPPAGNLIGMSPAGTIARTGCYIASKLSDSDASGKFTYTGTSYYCE